MSGLIRKAQTLLTSGASRSWGSDGASTDIPVEERREIMARIDQIVERNRMVVRPDSFIFRPHRRGGLMPFLINLVAILAIVLGGLLLVFLFRREESAIVVQSAGFRTAEGKLIEAIRRESEEQMAVKDREILDTQARLEEMKGERDRVQSESAARLQEQEQQLSAQFRAELDAERERLVREGLSGQELERRLQEYETRRRAEYDERLAALQAEVRRELQEKEATIASLITSYEATVTAAQGERQQLQEELARRQAELQADLRVREERLEADRSRIAAELETLAAQREREQLTQDQILSFYERVNAGLRSGRPEDARAELVSLRRFLDQAPVAALPAIERRRPVELFIIESLQSLMDQQRLAATPRADVAEVVASAEVVARVAALIEQGNNLYAAGNTPEARAVYENAMRQIPEVRAGYTRLQTIAELAGEADWRQAAEAIAAGDIQYRAAAYQGSIQRYGEAIRLLGRGRPELDGLIDRIADSGFRLYDSRRPQDTQTTARLQELERRIQASDAAGSAARETLEGLRRDYAAAQADRDAARAERDRLRTLSSAGVAPDQAALLARIEVADEARARADGRANRAEARVRELETAVGALTAERDAIGADLQALRRSHAALDGQRLSAQADLESARVRLAAAEKRAADAEGQLDSARAQLAAGERSATRSAAELEALRRQVAAGEEKAVQAAAQLAELERRRAALDAELADLQSRYQSLASGQGDVEKELASLQAAQGERRRVLDRLDSLRVRAQSPVATGSTSAAEISRLLEAKVLVKQIVGSDAVRAEYPGLYDALEEYFDLFGAQRADYGRERAYADLLAMLQTVEGNTVVAQPPPLASEAERGLLLRFLDRLRALVE